MARKKCMKPFCGRMYKATDLAHEEDRCDCGAPLEVMAEPTSEVSSARKSPQPSSVTEISTTTVAREECATTVEQHPPTEQNKPYIDANSRLVFPEDAPAESVESEESTLYDCLILYHQGEEHRIIPLLFDEIIIGRESRGDHPDIDLTELDPELRISRRHCLVYRYKGHYYVRNLSSKNSVHVNGEPVLQNQDAKLEDESLIVLSGMIGFEFLTKYANGDDIE